MGRRNLLSPHFAIILASLCTDAEQKYGDRDFGGREMALFFCQTEGKTQQASASITVSPPPLGIREDFICGARSPGYMIRIKVVKVLHSSSCIISKQSQLASGSRLIGSVCLWLLACDLLSEMQMLQRVICYKGVQDVAHIVLKSDRFAL